MPLLCFNTKVYVSVIFFHECVFLHELVLKVSMSMCLSACMCVSVCVCPWLRGERKLRQRSKKKDKHSCTQKGC